MDKNKINRINELARLSRERNLSESELLEQAALRKEYIEAYKKSLRSQLDNITLTDK